MPPAGFEPKISAGEGPQTNAFDRAATGTGFYALYSLLYRVSQEECAKLRESVP